MDRLIGELRGSEPGPVVLCVGGLHGSEPAGVHAAERFIRALEAGSGLHRGRLVAIRGNLGALTRGVRYIDRDLNRMWDADTVATVSNGARSDGGVELDELRAVLEILHQTIAEADGPICVLDLHTTSSVSIPFLWLVPSPGAQPLLDAYGVPIVHHPDGRAIGAFGYYAADLGCRVVIAEGGQHDAAEAVESLESMLWITCVELGLLDPRTVGTELARARELLVGRGGGATLYEVVSHHKLRADDGFRMKPNYRSFQPVSAGEVLAEDDRGAIRAERPGRVLMPLYRPPCDDGFMIVEERRAWPTADTA